MSPFFPSELKKQKQNKTQKPKALICHIYYLTPFLLLFQIIWFRGGPTYTHIWKQIKLVRATHPTCVYSDVNDTVANLSEDKLHVD